MSKIPLSKLRDISQSAKDVIDALAGKSEDVSPNDSGKMVQLYDYLNDVAAPPEMVKSMADELINLRETNQRLRAQRIAYRRRFANPAPESILSIFKKPDLPRMEGEQEPVADVVAWHKEGEERTCDIRWRRHDVAPGPLYAAPQQDHALVVPEKATPDDIEILASIRPPHRVAFQWDEDQRNAAADAWNACRGAMIENQK